MIFHFPYSRVFDGAVDDTSCLHHAHTTAGFQYADGGSKHPERIAIAARIKGFTPLPSLVAFAHPHSGCLG